MDRKIGITAAISALRAELEESILAAANEDLQFEVGEISLELQIEIAAEDTIGGGIKAWVIEGSAGTTQSKTFGHSVTIPLKPVGEDGGAVLTSQGSRHRPN